MNLRTPLETVESLEQVGQVSSELLPPGEGSLGQQRAWTRGGT